MRHKALIRRLQVSCLGLDHVDPLRLLVDDVIEALRENAMREVQRLGQEIEQEPVKYSDYEPDGVHHNKPPQRAWVGLTKEEVLEFTRASWGVGVTASEFIRAIEDKLKDKNDVAQETNS